MLMLSRKKEESIVIELGGEIVTITVTNLGVHSSKKQVQLGIDAPKNIKIWRSEIYEAIQENQRATEQHTVPANLSEILKNK